MFVYYLLIPIAFLAVLAVLSVGLYAMFKGGEFNKKEWRKWMQYTYQDPLSKVFYKESTPIIDILKANNRISIEL